MSENTDKLEVFYYFPCPVYVINKPEFLEDAKAACDEAVKKQAKEQKLNEIYPVYMTENLFDYKGMDQLTEFIGQSAWNILKDQGYAMQNFNLKFSEFWCQEHHKHSAMEQHVHGFGSQIVGFYFVDAPENCSRVVFHDPRSAKVQINLPENNVSEATPASIMINFEPKEGMIIFTNAWMAHSFTRHAADKPIRFIHFNLYPESIPQGSSCAAPAEVV